MWRFKKISSVISVHQKVARPFYIETIIENNQFCQEKHMNISFILDLKTL